MTRPLVMKRSQTKKKQKLFKLKTFSFDIWGPIKVLAGRL